MKKILKIGLGIMCVFVMSACSSSSSDDNNKKEETKTEYKQDETVTFEGVEYTITDVKKTTGEGYDQAKDGKEYVIVSLKIENKSDEKVSYNPYDWKMENSNGQEESQTFTTVDDDTTLSSGDLNKGGKVEGTIAFEEPKGDDGLKLNYYDNTLLDDEATFKIILN